jgi:hypothetical protein
MQATMLMLVGMAIATVIGVEIFERYFPPREPKHRRDGRA